MVENEDPKIELSGMPWGGFYPAGDHKGMMIMIKLPCKHVFLNDNIKRKHKSTTILKYYNKRKTIKAKANI